MIWWLWPSLWPGRGEAFKFDSDSVVLSKELACRESRKATKDVSGMLTRSRPGARLLICATTRTPPVASGGRHAGPPMNDVVSHDVTQRTRPTDVMMINRHWQPGPEPPNQHPDDSLSANLVA